MEETRNRSKILKKVFLYLFSGIFVLAGLLFALGKWYEDDITAYFLERLNQKINCKVEIQKVDFSLIRNFPYATVSLAGVKAYHSNNFPRKGELLIAERIDFSFNFWNLFSDNYEVNRIILSKSRVNLIIDKEGERNFDILKKELQNEQVNSKVDFKLNKLHFENCELAYSDARSNVYGSALFSDYTLKGAFEQEKFDLASKGELLVHQLELDSIVWIKDKPIKSELSLIADTKNSSYQLQESKLTVGKLELLLKGKVENKSDPYIDLTAEGADMDVTSIISLLPQRFAKKIEDYSSEGEIKLAVKIKGALKNKNVPSIRVDFSTHNLSVENTREDITMKQITCTGKFENQQGGILNFDHLNFKLNNGSFDATLRLQNLNKPNINLNLKADLALEDFSKFVSTDPLQNMKGMAKVDLKLNTSDQTVEEFKQGGYKNIKAEGTAQISDWSFTLKGDTLPYSNFNGTYRFHENEVRIENMQGLVGKSDIKLRGRLENLFGWLFGPSETLGFTAFTESKKVYVDQLMAKKPGDGKEKNAYSLILSPRIKMRLESRIGQLFYRKFRANDITGVLSLNNAVFKAEKLILKTMNGSIAINAAVEANSQNKFLIQSTSILKQVDINRLFYECENFGQTVMKDDNIKGTVDARVEIQAECTSDLSIDPAKVYCKMDLIINKGELILFEPLQALSKYIAVEDLRHVKFSELNNSIEIKDSKIYIPNMEIASNAITISASGTHTFDNEIDYHIRLLLSDVLSRKMKKNKKDDEFGEWEEDEGGKTNLFLSMKGPLTNPRISLDTKGVREKIKQDIKREKQSLKQMFKDEFGLFKNDTTLKPKADPPKKKNKVLIDFDEDDN